MTHFMNVSAYIIYLPVNNEHYIFDILVCENGFWKAYQIKVIGKPYFREGRDNYNA
jgi:hypothetical protein